MDINGICNIGCEFCYQDLDGSKLTKEEVLVIVKTKPDFGVVEIGGGEPMLHPELTDIVQGIVKEGRRAHISTNATVIQQRFLELDSDTKKSVGIQVSLHAADKTRYQEITGKDCFDAVVRNAQILRDNYNTGFNVVVYQRNLDQIGAILQIGYSLSMPVRVNLVFPVRKGNDVDRLKSEQINALRGLLLVEKIGHPGMVESPLLHEINCPALMQAYGLQGSEACPLSVGRKEYYDPKGQTNGCEFLRTEGV